MANWDALEHRLFKSVPPTTPDAVRTTRAAERASASAGSGRAFSAALRSPPRGSKSVGRWHAGLAPPPPSSSPAPSPSPTSKPQRPGPSFVARQEEDLAERRRLQRRRAAAPHDPEGAMTFKPTILPASEVDLAHFPCCRAKFCTRRRGPANKAPRRQGLRKYLCLAQRLAERGLARDRARFLSTPRDARRLASPPH